MLRWSDSDWWWSDPSRIAFGRRRTGLKMKLDTTLAINLSIPSCISVPNMTWNEMKCYFKTSSWSTWTTCPEGYAICGIRFMKWVAFNLFFAICWIRFIIYFANVPYMWNNVFTSLIFLSCFFRSRVHQGETDLKSNLGQTEVLFHCCQVSTCKLATLTKYKKVLKLYRILWNSVATCKLVTLTKWKSITEYYEILWQVVNWQH